MKTRSLDTFYVFLTQIIKLNKFTNIYWNYIVERHEEVETKHSVQPKSILIE